jgi:hypothetical protein
MSYAGNLNIRSVLVEDAFNRSITANTDILSEWHSVTKQRLTNIAFYTIEISLQTDDVLYVVYRNPSDPSVETIGTFLSGETLTENSLYIFTIGISEPYEFNLRCESNNIINYLLVTSHGGVY